MFPFDSSVIRPYCFFVPIFLNDTALTNCVVCLRNLADKSVHSSIYWQHKSRLINRLITAMPVTCMRMRMHVNGINHIFQSDYTLPFTVEFRSSRTRRTDPAGLGYASVLNLCIYKCAFWKGKTLAIGSIFIFFTSINLMKVLLGSKSSVVCLTMTTRHLKIEWLFHHTSAYWEIRQRRFNVERERRQSPNDQRVFLRIPNLFLYTSGLLGPWVLDRLLGYIRRLARRQDSGFF